MRKAFVAGATVAVLAVTAYALAPVVWSQTRPSDEKRERRVVMLDGRGSAIGVSIRDVEAADVAAAKMDRPGGVLIESVEENGPAEKAGLREGDIVIEFDGERVRSARHFARLVQETPDGRSVRATLVRGGARQTVDVTPSRDTSPWSGDLMHLPEIAGDIEREVERGMRALPRNFAFDFNWDAGVPNAMVWPKGRLGVQLSPLSDQLAAHFGAKQGVLVSSVEPDSAAAKAGLKAGDVITSINGQDVRSPRDVTEELREAEPGSEVAIGVLRDKKPLTLKAHTPERTRPAVRRSGRTA